MFNTGGSYVHHAKMQENDQSSSAGILNARDRQLQTGEGEKELLLIGVDHYEETDDTVLTSLTHKVLLARRHVTSGSFQSRWSNKMHELLGRGEVNTTEANGTDEDSEKPHPELHQVRKFV